MVGESHCSPDQVVVKAVSLNLCVSLCFSVRSEARSQVEESRYPKQLITSFSTSSLIITEKHNNKNNNK